MFFYTCPSCGASAYSAADASTVGACPRCSRPLAQHDDAPAACAGWRDQTMSGRPTHSDGRLGAAISDIVVKALARTTGRGPTQAKTTLSDNGEFVVVVVEPLPGTAEEPEPGEGRQP